MSVEIYTFKFKSIRQGDYTTGNLIFSKSDSLIEGKVEYPGIYKEFKTGLSTKDRAYISKTVKKALKFSYARQDVATDLSLRFPCVTKDKKVFYMRFTLELEKDMLPLTIYLNMCYQPETFLFAYPPALVHFLTNL